MPSSRRATDRTDGARSGTILPHPGSKELSSTIAGVTCASRMKMAGGGLLVFAGLKRGSLPGLLLAGAGAVLLAKAMNEGTTPHRSPQWITNARSGDIHRELGTEYPEATTRRWKDTV